MATALAGRPAKKKQVSKEHLHRRDEVTRTRIARILGQLEGVRRMLDEGRYCTDVIQQVRSIRSAVKGLECALLENHLKG